MYVHVKLLYSDLKLFYKILTLRKGINFKLNKNIKRCYSPHSDMHQSSLLLIFFSQQGDIQTVSTYTPQGEVVASKQCLAQLLKDLEVMNARLRSEEVGCRIMAQSQEIFDCCRGNPLLLFPLPEGDNGFALLPSCTCSWDETLALCHGKRPCQKRCCCVALSSICLLKQTDALCVFSFVLIFQFLNLHSHCKSE